MLKTKFKGLIRKWQNYLFMPVITLRDLILVDSSRELIKRHPNPLNRFGRKIFSQTDEDGLTMEILRRIGVSNGTFAEFGVGNGLENNTLVLAALGWSGFWVGGEDLAFALPQHPNPTFLYQRQWITRENILALTRNGLHNLAKSELDVISLDLDGNDIYLVEELLRGKFTPKLFIVEVNAKFAPPIRWCIEYNPQHRWNSDDYFGASLMSYIDLFQQHGYFLACCNACTGANAFFVSNTYRQLFGDVPEDISLVYSEPRSFLLSDLGNRMSPKTAEVIFRRKRSD